MLAPSLAAPSRLLALPGGVRGCEAGREAGVGDADAEIETDRTSQGGARRMVHYRKAHHLMVHYIMVHHLMVRYIYWCTI